jgi:coproporphyrinogen III oxidase
VHRGVGGIFYDHLEGDWDANFAFTQDVGARLSRFLSPNRAAADGRPSFTEAEIRPAARMARPLCRIQPGL